MSFEYLMDYPCKLRARLGDNASEAIIEARKNMNKYLTIREQMLDEDPNIEPDNEIITMQFMSTGGIREQQVQVGDLKKQFLEMETRTN